MYKREELIALIERLSLAFGPTGCEGEVASLLREALQNSGATLTTDAMGNLTARVGKAEGPRVMLAAHMDEVGFMITDIDDNGFLHFANLGGIDPRVMVGRPVTVGDEERRVAGVLVAKGIHFQGAEERKKLPDVKEMYIDIGTASREESEALVRLGDFGTFDTSFLRFGKAGAYLSGKALDDRVGCAVLVAVLHAVAGKQLPLDLHFAFTVREEIGISGATVTANRIAPDIGIVIETTAIADLPDVAPSRRVAQVGKGGVLSLLDRATIYDRDLVDTALRVGRERDIPVQVKRCVSGGNDADDIQRSGVGVRCLALSAPTRYLHAPVSVTAVSDIEAMVALITALLEEFAKEGTMLCTKH